MDERTGEQLGACVIISEWKATLYPNRPHQIRLEFEGGKDAADALLGAALARARTLCAERKEPSRIYARLNPDDAEMLKRLKSYGFKDNDGVVRMRAELPRADRGEAAHRMRHRARSVGRSAGKAILPRAVQRPF